MKITAAQLAQLLNGEVEGNPDAAITRPARIEEAGEGDFAFLDNPKYEHFAYSTQASVLLVHSSFRPSQPVRPTLVRVDDVRSSLAFLLEKFQNGGAVNGNGQKLISEQAAVHTTAQVGPNTHVGAFVVIEEGAVIGANCTIAPQVYVGRNVRIGDGCTLHSGVRVQADCRIGNNCLLHPNAVIGSDGFGFAPQEDRSWKRVPHVGNVVLEDDVEIGACSCIDRASLGTTYIRRGAKLDNLVHVAHNVDVGAHTAIAAQVGIAGSTRIGPFCQLGGQAGFAGHLTLAEGTLVQAQSGVGMNTTEPGLALFGSPAFGFRDFMRSHWVFKQLPELHRKVRDLEKKLENLNGL